MRIKRWNVSSKTEESLSVNLLTRWQYHPGQFGAFWRAIWRCRIAAKFVPRLFSGKQEECVYTCRTLTKRPESKTEFLSTIITGSKTQKPSKSTVSGKDILSVSKTYEIRSFTCEENVHGLLSRHSHGILHYSFVPQGQTVKLTWLYIDTLRSLLKNVWRKEPENCSSRDWFLHHNATGWSPSFDWISGQQQNECRFTPSLATNAVWLPSCPTIQDDVKWTA